MGIVQYPVDCDCGDTIWIGQWSEPHECRKCGKTWVAYDKIYYTEVKEIIQVVGIVNTMRKKQDKSFISKNESVL